MTDAQFDVIATLIGTSKRTRQAARRILLDGAGPTLAGQEVGISRSSAHNAATRIKRAYTTLKAVF